jgi:hypothetical protein
MPDENEPLNERKTLDDRAGAHPALVQGVRRIVNNYRQAVDGVPARDSFSL